ncbi:hypothetical protein FVE67_07000 [Thermosulfurimonas marina]|uniref:Uncharacterized protein n=1 Tax=Thermosulfurimonas marina TaxID=2047767 RepID=A0A6H1WTW2_9BACT|nr:hypothetical protein [Thermosulfurimonas marina]QJA06556.1 hypothetical protein FVE67_07000 [Thermosulfurimonas marina]
MEDLRALLLRCKEDLARRDFEALSRDFERVSRLRPEELTLDEAWEVLTLLEELVAEAAALKEACARGLSGVEEIQRTLRPFLHQLRYLLLRFG